MLKRETRIHLEHPNKTRRFVNGELCNISPTYKCHRKPIPYGVQRLADDLNRLITFFRLDMGDCISIIRHKFGEGVGKQSFWDHFLNKKYGVGFNPRHDTLVKYRYLRKVLNREKIKLAKGEASAIIHSLPTPIPSPPEENPLSLPVKDQEGSPWRIVTPRNKDKAIRIKVKKRVQTKPRKETKDYHLNEIFR